MLGSIFLRIRHSMRLFQHKLIALPAALLVLAWVSTISSAQALVPNAGESGAGSEVYGPTNLLKNLRNPFMSTSGSGDASNSVQCPVETPISIGNPDGQSEAVSKVERTLSRRLALPHLYLPGRLIMGKPAEFIVKGKPGYYAALAMADRDSGAKPIYGHTIHLGPDRKVVSVGTIPESGLLHLWIEAPFEGDLMGLPLYFEAAVWSNKDFGDLEIAVPVMPESAETKAAGSFNNGVIMAAGADMLKKDRLVVPESSETTMQHLQYTGSHLDSGRP